MSYNWNLNSISQIFQYPSQRKLTNNNSNSGFQSCQHQQVQEQARQIFPHFEDLGRTINFNDLEVFNYFKNVNLASNIQVQNNISNPVQSKQTESKAVQRQFNLKTLAKQVFEIMLQSNCKVLTYQAILTKLSQKNQQQFALKPSCCKNIKRRLYDTINVLNATNVLQKSRKTLNLHPSKQLDPAQYQQLQSQEKLQRQFSEISLRVAYKKNLMKLKLSRIVFLQKLIDRNKNIKSQLKQSQKFMMPIIMLQLKQKTCISIQQNLIQIQNPISPIKFETDLDILNYIFLTDQSEIQQLKNNLLSKENFCSTMDQQ